MFNQLAPLLSNILLDELDKKLTRERLPFARYADDIIILVKSKHIGNRVKVEISRYISKRLKLIVNETKSRVGPVSGSKFLGFTFQQGRLQIHAKSLKLFKEKVRSLTNRNWGIAMKKQIHKLNLFLRGWGHYFLIANAYQLTVDLDSWIRRRLRMSFPSTKVAAMAKTAHQSEKLN